MKLITKEQAVPIAASAMTIAFLLIGIEFLTTYFAIPKFIIPSPSDVYTLGFKRSLNDIAQNTVVTAYETVTGFLSGSAVGIISAILISYSRTVRATLYPLIIFLQQVPKSALAPLFVVWFGFGLQSKIMIALLIAFFPVLINTAAGLASVPVELIDLASSLKVSRFQSFRRIEFPYATPSIFSGLKIGISLALVGAIVGEFVGASAGLGYLIILTQYDLRTPLMFACFGVLGLLGFTLFGAVGLAERLVIPWYSGMKTKR